MTEPADDTLGTIAAQLVCGFCEKPIEPLTDGDDSYRCVGDVDGSSVLSKRTYRENAGVFL